MTTNNTAMKKQVSALNTFWIVEYLKNNFLNMNFTGILNQVNRERPFLIENLKTGKIEPVSILHLTDTAYWLSNEFMIKLYATVQARVPDPNLAYKIGKSCCKSDHILKTAIGIPLLGPYRLLKIISKENKKYNRTKESLILKIEKGRVVIRLIHNNNIIVNQFAIDWHSGIFESYARISGATNIRINATCVEKGPEKYGDPGRGIWDFDIHFQYRNLGTRIFNAILSQIPSIKTIIINSNKIQAEYNEQILNRDRIIREKADKLKAIHDKLFKVERENIKRKLQNISTELVATEEREKRLIAEDLHDSVSQSLALSLFKIKNITGSTLMGNLDELTTVEKTLEKAVSDLRSLTFQISPPILYSLGLEATIKWLVSDINTRNELKILFNNNIKNPAQIEDTLKTVLYRSVRELIINILKHSNAQTAQVTLSLLENQFIISVEDDGVGFDTGCLENRNSLGFGLINISDRIKALGGDIEIYSEPGKGSNILILSPLLAWSENLE
ncbi:sensor histidine kinase [Desulforapulum autotrophicum]|nr:sensor histidine kinase [Desulforapulum autotrophicum]